MEGLYRNKTSILPNLSEYKFENIFKIYLNTEGYFFYNIIKKIKIPDDINSDIYDSLRLNRKLPYTAISYVNYNTIDLWWLICLVNNIRNPLELLEPGTLLKIIKPTHIPGIIDEIKSQLK
jgi:hypothetical protein